MKTREQIVQEIVRLGDIEGRLDRGSDMQREVNIAYRALIWATGSRMCGTPSKNFGDYPMKQFQEKEAVRKPIYFVPPKPNWFQRLLGDKG